MNAPEPVPACSTPRTALTEPINALRHVDPALLRHKFALAGWITLIAEDRGLTLEAVAEKTGLDLQEAKAVLEGTVVGVPLRVLDRALCRLEGRVH